MHIRGEAEWRGTTCPAPPLLPTSVPTAEPLTPNRPAPSPFLSMNFGLRVTRSSAAAVRVSPVPTSLLSPSARRKMVLPVASTPHPRPPVEPRWPHRHRVAMGQKKKIRCPESGSVAWATPTLSSSWRTSGRTSLMNGEASSPVSALSARNTGPLSTPFKEHVLQAILCPPMLLERQKESQTS